MSGVGLRVCLLGPLEVRRGDAVVTLAGTKQRLLVAVLALQVGRVVSVDTLVDALWADRPPRGEMAALQAHVSALRRVLDSGDGTVVVHRPPGYLLDLPEDAVDLREFEDLVERARAAARSDDPAAAAALFRAAEQLWRGDALADLAAEPMFAGAAAALDSARLDAVGERIDADLSRGAHGDVLSELRELVAAHPLREDLWASLMVALYRSDRQAEALAAFADARTTLVEQLGVDPGPVLRSLEQSILLQSPDLDLPPPAPPAAVVGVLGTTVVGAERSAPPAHLLVEGEPVSLGNRTTIGRHPDCSLVLSDPRASRWHAVIRVASGRYLLGDMGSTNGTRIGGDDVVEERALDPGDEIEIGSTRLRFELD